MWTHFETVHIKMQPAYQPMQFPRFGPQHFKTERAQIETRLDQLPSGQLAMVHYSPAHETVDEWVYNCADIYGSNVI